MDRKEILRSEKMKIDIFNHIITPKYWHAFKKLYPTDYEQKTALWDLKQRFLIMDKFDDYTQVLTFSSPPVEAIAEPKKAVELARIGNEEMAELVVKYPERFVAAVAHLPMNDVDAALKETDRAIKDLKLSGVLVYTNINGKPLDSPEFMPLYEKMARYDLPIWIHPRRDDTVADYSTESESKYRLVGALGWPYETQLAMSRLVCSGILERYPNLKFVTHHCGGGIPFLAKRVAVRLETIIRQEPDSSLSKLTKKPMEYLRMFYGDTSIGDNKVLECGHAYFGAERIVFATDMPYGKEQGESFMREAIKDVMKMAIPESEKKLIFEGNARRILHLR